MGILNCMDKKYVCVREGIDFHYFGEGCIADYYNNTVGFLDEKDMNIVDLCVGDKTFSEVIFIANKKYDYEVDEIQQRIKELRKKGVIIFRDEMHRVTFSFFGERGLYYPKEIAIELTNACNYNCPFCYKNAQNNGIYISDNVINEIKKTIGNNVRQILLTGGEPTLHPHYQQYISMFASDSKVTMISNGSVLYQHQPDALKELDCVQFTIYGCNNTEYEKMTGAKDGFTRLQRSIDHIQNNGIATQAAVTLCDSTMDHVEEFVQTAISLGFDSLKIGLADVFGRGKYLFESKNTYVQDQNNVYQVLLALKRKYRKSISFELPNINAKHVAEHKDICAYIHRGALSCGCGSEYLAISPKGTIRPCQMLPDEWFSVQKVGGLIEHINGDFHIDDLRCAARSYYRHYGFDDSGFSPCQALDELMCFGGEVSVSNKQKIVLA